jgi:phosphoheptose isomerase
MLDFENLGDRFVEVVNSQEWQLLQQKFNMSDDIYVLGHGGNLAIADHAAVDITRLTAGRKNALCPGSGVVATSLINDYGFDDWMVQWMELRTKYKTQEQLSRSLVVAISSSGHSTDSLKALKWATKNGMSTAVITGRKIKNLDGDIVEVNLDVKKYHTGEVLTLLLTYQLTEGSGTECPAIKGAQSKRKRHWRGKVREYSFPDEEVNIAIDFDGVIHNSDKGFHDGTLYGEPLDHARESLEKLSKEYNVIIFSCKAKPDRPLISGKTGIELIWEWLKKHNLDKYVTEVTSEKPRAKLYVDDRAIKFTNWKEAMDEIGH